MNKFKFLLIILSVFALNFGCVKTADDENSFNPIIAGQPISLSYTEIIWGMDGSDKKEWAQSFRVSGKTACSAVEIYMGTKSNNVPTGNYEISIETDNSGQPSGSNVNPNAFLAKAPAAILENSWNKWTFPASFNLNANTTYWIVCKTDETNSNQYCNIRILIAGTYSPGFAAGYVNGAFDQIYPTSDMIFRVYR